jgi:phospholipid N-methyltransferase
VDVIISTLPFVFIPKDETKRILLEIKKSLKKDGQFIQYQYFLSEFKLIKNIFEKDKIDLSFELLNLPPAFIYSLRK